MLKKKNTRILQSNVPSTMRVTVISKRTEPKEQKKYIYPVSTFTLSPSVYLTHGSVFVLTDTTAQMKVRHWMRKDFLLNASYTTL